MKKLVLTSVCTLALAGAAFAQGSVNWSSISFSYVTAQTNSTQYSPLLGGGSVVGGATGLAAGNASAGTGFYWELLDKGGFNLATPSTNGVAPTTLSGLGSWSDTGLSATNSNTAGRLQVIAGNNGATANNFVAGTTNYIILVGWSANLGTSWTAASANLGNATYLGNLTTKAYFGISNVGYIAPQASGVSPGAAPFGNAANAYGSPIYSLNTPLYLVPVPEPGTMALAALGGASLLLFRRRK